MRCCACWRRCGKGSSHTDGGNDSSDDSFEEKDDICIEDAKPKNPFTFQKNVVEETKKNVNNPIKDRFKYYGAQSNMGSNVRVQQKTPGHQLPNV